MQRQYSTRGKSSHMLYQMWRSVFHPARSPLKAFVFHAGVLTHVSKGRVACFGGGSAVGFGHGRNGEGAERQRRELVLSDWLQEIWRGGKKLTRTIFVATCYWITPGCYYIIFLWHKLDIKVTLTVKHIASISISFKTFWEICWFASFQRMRLQDRCQSRICVLYKGIEPGRG